jgi:hypothetical protein
MLGGRRLISDHIFEADGLFSISTKQNPWWEKPLAFNQMHIPFWETGEGG